LTVGGKTPSTFQLKVGGTTHDGWTLRLKPDEKDLGDQRGHFSFSSTVNDARFNNLPVNGRKTF